jgi:hypothetical protein
MICICGCGGIYGSKRCTVFAAVVEFMNARDVFAAVVEFMKATDVFAAVVKFMKARYICSRLP